MKEGAARPSEDGRSRGGLGRVVVRVALRAGLLAGLVHLLSSVRFVVEGESMAPTLAGGHYLLVTRAAYWAEGPRRGDIVVARPAGLGAKEYVKRVVGLPGESVAVEGGRVVIGGAVLHEPYLKGQVSGAGRSAGELPLGADEYYLLGDDRADSRDSRVFGPVKRGEIVGRVWFRYRPSSVWGRIPQGDGWVRKH